MEPLSQATIPQALLAAQQHLRARRFQQAETLYRQILALEPEQPKALYVMGLLAMRAQDPHTAIDLLRRAATAAPHDHDSHIDLGNALLSVGRIEDAIASYHKALALRPDSGGAQTNLGIAYYRSGRIEQAISLFHQAAAKGVDHPAVYNNLGNALLLRGRITEAIAAFERAISLHHDDAETHGNLGNALMRAGRVEDAIAAVRMAIQINPRAVVSWQILLYFLPFDQRYDAAAILQEHRRWNQTIARPLAQKVQPHRNSRDPDRPLRVGYVSPDFREHAVATFLAPLLAAHDPANVWCYCYADLRRPDKVSKQLQQHARQWRPITNTGDDRVAELIRQDEIDILVDLAGHTAGNRLLVFAQKPAPVQVTYLGYPNTTGLTAMDYCMTDVHIDPPGMTEGHFSEQLIRLPETFACYGPPAGAPEVVPPPAVSTGSITFASFNRLSKLNAGLIECWSEILRQVPYSRLLLGSAGLQEPQIVARYRSMFERHGISADRLELLGRLPMNQHLAMHNRADVLLDTFPVNGHTVTCHGLWMGVPPVCLAGTTHAGRFGVSLLHNLNLTELLARTRQEYVQIAVRLAGDLPRLQELRASMRSRMRNSPLMDARRFAAQVEQAYRTIWRRWCAGQSPGAV